MCSKQQLMAISNTKVWVLLHQTSEEELVERLQHVGGLNGSKYARADQDKDCEET